jgi:hypothetical protein
MRPADQGLRADDLVALQRDLRLVDDAQLAPAGGALELTLGLTLTVRARASSSAVSMLKRPRPCCLAS